MRVSLRQLKKGRVETVSGVFLGHVVDVEMDTEGQMVVNYHVRRSVLGGDVLLISRNQIVRFEEEKMVVDDSLSKEYAVVDKGTQIAGSPEPAVMRET